jgi:hypothetical protein
MTEDLASQLNDESAHRDTGFVKTLVTKAARSVKLTKRRMPVTDIASPMSVILQPRTPCGVFFRNAGDTHPPRESGRYHRRRSS